MKNGDSLPAGSIAAREYGNVVIVLAVVIGAELIAFWIMMP